MSWKYKIFQLYETRIIMDPNIIGLIVFGVVAVAIVVGLIYIIIFGKNI